MLYTPMEHSVILQKMTDTNDIQTQMISFLSRFSIYIYICIYIYIYIYIYVYIYIYIYVYKSLLALVLTTIDELCMYKH